MNPPTPRPERPNPWTVLPRPNPRARLRLFCFPFAGGGASIYTAWARLLPPEVELVAVQLPGRESRLAEPAISHIDELTPRLAAELAPLMDRPFALFGHSNGALMAFELARHLRREGRRGLMHLFASGRPAPQLPLTEPPLHALPHDEFLDALRRFNGTPEEVLQNPEIMELIAPTLRADFSLGETYRYTPEAPLAVPLSAYGGLRDVEVPPEQVDPWREQTSAAFRLRMFPGDHFFVIGERHLVIEELNHELRGVLTRLAAYA